MSRKGRIVSIEGVDGIGKLTQSELLEQWLKTREMVTATLSFPDYETGIGKEIRAFLDGDRDFLPGLRHMLFAANRWEKVPEILRLQKSTDVIITNRYSESNLVYGVANGLDLDWLIALEEGVPKSDVVLVLDAPTRGLLNRRLGDKDKYERDTELQVRVRKVYKRLAPKFGWTIVDASGDIDAVHRLVTTTLAEKMARWSGRQ